jgi:hypothetical protein
LGVRSFKC